MPTMQIEDDVIPLTFSLWRVCEVVNFCCIIHGDLLY